MRCVAGRQGFAWRLGCTRCLADSEAPSTPVDLLLLPPCPAAVLAHLCHAAAGARGTRRGVPVRRRRRLPACHHPRLHSAARRGPDAARSCAGTSSSSRGAAHGTRAIACALAASPGRAAGAAGSSACASAPAHAHRAAAARGANHAPPVCRATTSAHGENGAGLRARMLTNSLQRQQWPLGCWCSPQPLHASLHTPVRSAHHTWRLLPATTTVRRRRGRTRCRSLSLRAPPQRRAPNGPQQVRRPTTTCTPRVPGPCQQQSGPQHQRQRRHRHVPPLPSLCCQTRCSPATARPRRAPASTQPQPSSNRGRPQRPQRQRARRQASARHARRRLAAAACLLW